VIAEKNGTWGNAQPITGSPTSVLLTYALATAVSCPTPRSCAASGWYQWLRARGRYQYEAVVINKHGTWSKAIPVPACQPPTQPP